MLGAIEEMLSSAPPSVVRAHSTLVKAVYLKGVKRQLGEDPKNIMYQLEELRHSLFDFFNPRVLVIADVEKLSNPVSTWNILAPKLGSNKAVSPLETRLSRLSEAGRNPGSLSYIVPMPTIDSSYALSVAKGPSTLRDPRIPALMVAFSYLDAVEGPLWTAVRGTGLAYGTNFGRHTESGQISFSVYRSPNALKAFETCKNVVEGLASAETELEPSALEGAVTSIVLGFANAQSTMAMTAQMSFVRQVIMELPSEWNDLILAKIREVRVSEIKKTMKDVILPAFDATTANLIITCAPVMEEELMKGFRKLGFNPEVRALAYFQDDYGMTGGSDSDLTEDEEDERGDECEDEE